MIDKLLVLNEQTEMMNIVKLSKHYIKVKTQRRNQLVLIQCRQSYEPTNSIMLYESFGKLPERIM